MPPEYFEEQSVWLFDMIKNIKKEFLITSSNINHDTMNVTLTLRDDDSLLFNERQEITETNLEYNYTKWTELELRHKITHNLPFNYICI